MQVAAEQTAELTGIQPIIGHDFLTRESLAKELRVSPRTISRWVALRQGPPRIRIGKFVFFRREAVTDWLLSRESDDGRKRRRS